MKLKKGDIVKIKGTDKLATVNKVSRDGIIHIRLDQPPGATLRIHQSSLCRADSVPSKPSVATQVPSEQPLDERPNHAPTTAPAASVPPDSASVSSAAVHSSTGSSLYEQSTQPRQSNGQYAPGGSHPYYPPNPEHRERVATARSLRQSLLTGMADLVDSLPRIIGSINDPEKKASAINQTLKIILPQYSSIKFSDAPPRSLSAEQELAELKRKFKESQK